MMESMNEILAKNPIVIDNVWCMIYIYMVIGIGADQGGIWG